MIRGFDKANIAKLGSDKEMTLLIDTNHLDIFTDERSFVIDDNPQEIWVRETLPQEKREGLKMYRFVRRIKKVKAKVKSAGVGIYEPCLICAKTLRNDYAGLCMDCADSMGLTT